MKINGSIVLKKGKEVSIQRYHPWIFSGAINSSDDTLKDGEWARIKESTGKVLGYGHYHQGTIALRVLSFGEQAPRDDFYKEKMDRCYQLRYAAGVITEQTNAYRLVHGEGDGLSGLIVDMYNGVAIVQVHSVGMYLDRELIVQALQSLYKDNLSTIYLKAPSASGDSRNDGYLFGMSAIPHIIQEHGYKFYVDWETGQKTGFFLDQRENRKLLGEYSKGKSVLNTFCYTGGFSIYALQAGASIVHSVDASEKAIALTKRNIELNGFDNEQHASYAIDTFEFFKDKKDQYDIIILDPPAFAKHKSAKHQAMKGYQRLNAEAFRVIKSGGIIFTFSCSQVVNRQLFYDTIVSAAIQSGRQIKVLHHLSQPADHPVSIYHPEGSYLKGLILYVE
ncbi:MAG TPA: RlmI/RlmK family 23S rRNA methyltransferase [Cytophagales bacterium]|nr:RlmI/RlmK family 23S rRNA methyltransferase [Cytophagales bacterium]HCR55034.1 RlmI/RlmK family 23S rRNA methyltransferase [Cytophagales bacterium]